MRVLITDDSQLPVERLVVSLAKIRGIDIVGQTGTASATLGAIPP
jgi:DNA-binding LytR/AlgR family response regulator